MHHGCSTYSISKSLPNTNIPDVHTLEPKDKHLSLSNQYSGTFGLDFFPYHSDLAHWRSPPRYLFLRCIRGSSEVATNLILSSNIIEKINRADIKRAVFRTRRKSPNVSPSLLPLMFKIGQAYGLRWDSLFLIPMNSSAWSIKAGFETMDLDVAQETKLFLSDPGDSILIDNWKMLHGRSRVPPSAKNRKIERVYLSGLKE